MSDEIETKVPVEKEEKATSESAANGLSALDLLSGAVTGAAAGAAAADGGKIGKDFGKLEITDNRTAGSLRDLITNQGERIENSLEQLGRKLENKELPLSRTERLVMNGVRDAIRSGDMSKVQDMLQALNENPKSVDRILGALNKEMQAENPLNSMSWEQGKDSNGNSFVRLRLNHQNDFSKSSGSTEVTIGSDGRNSAVYTKRWDSQPIQVDPSSNMHHFGRQKEHFLPHYDSPTYKGT